jgi:hypothetical protein
VLFISKIHLNVGLIKEVLSKSTNTFVSVRERERERVMWACFEKEELPHTLRGFLSLSLSLQEEGEKVIE